MFRQVRQSIPQQDGPTDQSRDLAANIGIPYMTPEEYFLHEEPRPWIRTFDPSKYLSTINDSQTDTCKAPIPPTSIFL